MHIAIFLDQHPDTLGGAQLSAVMQARYLRELGHTVTICAPSSYKAKPSEDVVVIPSWRLGLKGEYEFFVPSKKVLQLALKAFSDLPPVDVVHIQADFWGAALGYDYARHHNLPTVLTFHNNVPVGTRQVLGSALSPIFIGWISSILTRSLGDVGVRTTVDGWRYLAQLGEASDLRLAPTAHFARDLEDKGVKMPIKVASNGLDDQVIAETVAELASSSKKRQKNKKRPLLIWTGRMSKEKRLMEFLRAIRLSEVEADIAIYGSGDLMAPAKHYVSRYRLPGKVKFYGSVSPTEMLKAIAGADILVQTSIGFETQGRTVIEALAFGVPVVLCDPLIAEDFDERSYWLVKDATIDALANTLKMAVASVGTPNYKTPPPELRTAFLQGRLSQAMVEHYKGVIDLRNGSK